MLRQRHQDDDNNNITCEELETVRRNLIDNKTKTAKKRNNSFYILHRGQCWLTLPLFVILLYLLYYFVLDEFAWVHSRCLKSWILHPGNIVYQIQCIEASTHERATLDSTLWFDDSEDIFDIPFHPATMAKYIHYTITTAPTSSQGAFSLTLCSVEASGRICQAWDCSIQIWIVHQAATNATSTTSWFQELEITLKPYPHCFRIIEGGNRPTVLIGSACPLQTQQEEQNSSICGSNHNKNSAYHMLQQWLTTSPLVENTLPAHISDGWRLVALASAGGLYLDTDVVPLSNDIVQLPGNTIPTQDKVGAYRLNGGTLRLNTCLLLQELMKDYLQWASLLASSLSLQDQTFGFLGPCALTRVYTTKRGKEPVTILPPYVVEPPLDCRGDDKNKKKKTKKPLALHFSGHRKHSWQRHFHCWDDRIKSSCPQTLIKIGYKI